VDKLPDSLTCPAQPQGLPTERDTVSAFTEGAPLDAAILRSNFEIHLDEEFRHLIPPLSAEERAHLERSLLTEGCRDPLVVWKEGGILLDGYNRLALCKQHGLRFHLAEIELPDRDAARAWIIAHQISRRNLSPLAVSYLRGKHYHAAKQSHGGDRQNGQAGGNSCHLRTEQVLADEYKVAPRTIRNDAEFAAAVDCITTHCGDAVKQLILSRDAHLTRGDVEWLAEQPASVQRQLLRSVQATGRLIRPRPLGQQRRLVVLAQPEALAHTVVNRLGYEAAEEVYQVLGTILRDRGSSGSQPMP